MKEEEEEQKQKEMAQHCKFPSPHLVFPGLTVIPSFTQYSFCPPPKPQATAPFEITYSNRMALLVAGGPPSGTTERQDNRATGQEAEETTAQMIERKIPLQRTTHGHTSCLHRSSRMTEATAHAQGAPIPSEIARRFAGSSHKRHESMTTMTACLPAWANSQILGT